MQVDYSKLWAKFKKIGHKNKSLLSAWWTILAAKKVVSSADTTALEHKIDELVYKLYGLIRMRKLPSLRGK